MLLIHEQLPKEADHVRLAIKAAYRIDNISIFSIHLNKFFTPIPAFEGYWAYPIDRAATLLKKFNEPALVITPKDIYSNDQSKNDDWVFGHAGNKLMIASIARMKRYDNQPSATLAVPESLYLQRLAFTVLHEIGHEVIHASHYQEATWVNAQTGHQLSLGPHCTNNTCLMYEIVDITAPPADQGYMQLGTEKKYDTGLDAVIQRLDKSWLCSPCRAAINLDEFL